MNSIGFGPRKKPYLWRIGAPFCLLFIAAAKEHVYSCVLHSVHRSRIRTHGHQRLNFEAPRLIDPSGSIILFYPVQIIWIAL